METKINMQKYGVSPADLKRRKEVLSEYLGQGASDNDVVLSIFSVLADALVKAREFGLYRNLTWDKALIFASKGKDPKNIFESANNTLDKFGELHASFFGDEEIGRLRAIGEEEGDQVPERMYLCADPTPAVLDELRKIYSQRAWAAREENDWQAVVDNLEKYNSLANQHRDACLDLANALPPEHTDEDKQLLEKARVEINKNSQERDA